MPDNSVASARDRFCGSKRDDRRAAVAGAQAIAPGRPIWHLKALPRT
jgi:hypothetical protein